METVANILNILFDARPEKAFTGKSSGLSMHSCRSCSCAKISLRSGTGIKNFLSFEDDSIFNCQFMAIVPEFTQIVWYFFDCIWLTNEEDLVQTAKSRQFRNMQFRV